MDDTKQQQGAEGMEGLVVAMDGPGTHNYGAVISECRQLVEAYGKPWMAAATDPLTGTIAPLVISKAGVIALDDDVFSAYRERPVRRSGTATFTSLDSLIDHINRYRDEHSVVFANDDRARPSLTAVLDYHEKGADGLPRFGVHRSQFAFPLSDEWTAWTARNAKPMAMTDFAAFLEDRVIDVLHLDPEQDDLSDELKRFITIAGGNSSIASPAKLIELSRGLRINETSVVKEVNNLSTGEGQVLFETQHSDEHGKPLRIPTMFLIGIPVFKNGPLYRIAARLRYRKQNGISFWFELWRADRVFDHAFREACDRIHAETELPVLFGVAE